MAISVFEVFGLWFLMKLTVSDLAERIGAKVVGNGSAHITGVGPVEASGESDVTFIRSPESHGQRWGVAGDGKYMPGLENSKAGAVIVAGPIADLDKPQLVVKSVDAALIEVLKLFAPKLKGAPGGIDPTAKVADKARIGKDVSVGAAAVIDDGVEIGANSVIGSGCKIGENSKVGRNCRLDSNVVVYHNCTIGNNVTIQANSTIGSTGFGYSFVGGEHKLIPHNGGVVIEDFVEIGANCCVDRAKFGNTTIGAGTKIDNLVQIAHNVVIGKCCLIGGQVGVSGSCKLGNGIILEGQAGVADNVEIGEGTTVGAQSGVTHDMAAGQQLLGMPAADITKALRVAAMTRRLPKLAEQSKQLIKRIERLEAAKYDKE